MTLEELQQQVDKDFKLDDTELDSESIKIPLLHNKYLQHFNKFSLLLKKAEYDHKVMTRLKWEYYTGKSDPSVYKEKPFDLKILKADVHIYMVSYLEQVLRSINSRTFLIKNAIEWKKFTSGAI